MKKQRAAAVLNLVSACLAVLVVTGSTLYVVSEQPWFQTNVRTAAGDFPFVGMIRDKFSHHR